MLVKCSIWSNQSLGSLVLNTNGVWLINKLSCKNWVTRNQYLVESQFLLSPKKLTRRKGLSTRFRPMIFSLFTLIIFFFFLWCWKHLLITGGCRSQAVPHLSLFDKGVEEGFIKPNHLLGPFTIVVYFLWSSYRLHPTTFKHMSNYLFAHKAIFPSKETLQLYYCMLLTINYW